MAVRNVKGEFLRRWWVAKYRLPPTSDEYLRYTYEELILEYLEDLYANKPDMFAKFKLPEESEAEVAAAVVEDAPFEGTGDPEIDELERRLAAGEEIGIEDLEILEPKKGTATDQKSAEGVPDAEEFSDDYTDSSAPKA